MLPAFVRRTYLAQDGDDRRDRSHVPWLAAAEHHHDEHRAEDGAARKLPLVLSLPMPEHPENQCVDEAGDDDGGQQVGNDAIKAFARCGQRREQDQHQDHQALGSQEESAYRSGYWPLDIPRVA